MIWNKVRRENYNRFGIKIVKRWKNDVEHFIWASVPSQLSTFTVAAVPSNFDITDQFVKSHSMLA